MTWNNPTKRLLTALRKVGLVFAPWTRCFKPSRRDLDQASCGTWGNSTQGVPAQDARQTINSDRDSDAETMVHSRTSIATTTEPRIDPNNTEIEPKEEFGRTATTGPGSTTHLEKMDPPVNPINVSPVKHEDGSGLATKPDETSKYIETDSKTQGKEFQRLYHHDPENPEMKARKIKDQGQRQRDDFLNSGNIYSLEEAIKCFQEAGDLLRHTSSDDRIFVLNDLAVALRLHHNHTHNPGSLAKVIETLREAIQLQPENHSSAAVLKSSLALALSAHFDQSGDTSALVEAIELQKDLVQHSPESQRFRSLTRLATSLAKQFFSTGDEEALIQSIDCHREALKPISRDDPDHLSPLIELATVLAKRFEGVHDIETHLKSINRLRHELPPSESRDSLIEDLSQALGKYFERTRGGSGAAEVHTSTNLAGDCVVSF